MARAQVVPGLLGVWYSTPGLGSPDKTANVPHHKTLVGRRHLSRVEAHPFPAPHHTRAPGTSRWLTWLRIGPRRRSKRKSQSKSCFGRPETGTRSGGAQHGTAIGYACNPLKTPSSSKISTPDLHIATHPAPGAWAPTAGRPYFHSSLPPPVRSLQRASPAHRHRLGGPATGPSGARWSSVKRSERDGKGR